MVGRATTALPYLNTLCLCVVARVWIDPKFVYLCSTPWDPCRHVEYYRYKKFETWFNVPLVIVFLLFYIGSNSFDLSFILIVAGIALFISPMYDIIKCCISHVTIKTSRLFLWVSVVNTSVWVVYGVVHGLWTVWMSNAIGLVFILIQMIVIFVQSEYKQGIVMITESFVYIRLCSSFFRL